MDYAALKRWTNDFFRAAARSRRAGRAHTCRSASGRVGARRGAIKEPPGRVQIPPPRESSAYTKGAIAAVRTRFRAAARFTACELGEHLLQRVKQVLARAGQITVTAPGLDLATPMVGHIILRPG